MITSPLWPRFICLTVLILLSAFFAISETALMRASRHKLQHLATQGSRAAAVAVWLQERTDRLLSLILIFNTLINALVAVLVAATAMDIYGSTERVLIASIGLTAVLLIIFAEIIPKIIGATFPERTALLTSLALKPLMALTRPVTWIIELFLRGLLRLLHFNSQAARQKQVLTIEELRLLLTEAGSRMSTKHQAILMNLFDLERISVEDVMTPRAKIEALNLDLPASELRVQLLQARHDTIPAYEGEINRIAGILPVRKALGLLERGHPLSRETIRSLLIPTYFVPQDTDVLSQLQYFQENRERVGVVVDEYGEVQGLVTVEDILEEMIGEFTVSRDKTHKSVAHGWNQAGQCELSGAIALRDLNRQFGLDFPLHGSKTLNGFLLDYLQDIPEHLLCLRMKDCLMEITRIEHQAVKTVLLTRLQPATTA